MTEKKNYKDIDITTEYKSLQDIVYDRLLDGILSGDIEPNTELNTLTLSHELNISRTPIREAINKLISLGLVEKVNHKGARVADFLSDEMHEIFYIRAALEGLAAKSAARDMPPADRLRLMEMAHEMERLSIEGGTDEFMEKNYEFHHLLYTCIRTPLIHSLIEQFYIITRRYRMFGFNRRSKQVNAEHYQLAQAVFDGDEATAERIGVMHHSNTLNAVDRDYK